MSKIFDLSWNEDGLWAKFKLVCLSEYQQYQQEDRRSLCAPLRVGALSSLSSTYYSVAGSSFSRVRNFPINTPLSNPVVVLEIIFRLFQIPFWLLLGGYCFLKMLPTSNKMLEIAGGYENLTADQCDIRQSILRRWIKRKEALDCIGHGLLKNPNPHCKALLLIGRAYCLVEIDLIKNEQSLLKDFEDILDIARKTVESEPQQTSRILNHCAILCRLWGSPNSKSYEQDAREIALRFGIKNQLLKI